MNEPRNRSRKVTRKAGPPEENAGAAAADVAPVFQAPSQEAVAAAPSRQSIESAGEADSDTGKKSTAAQSEDSQDNRGGNRTRTRSRGGRGRGRGGSGAENNAGGENRGGNNSNNSNNNNSRGRRNVVKSMQGHDLTKRLPEPPKQANGSLRIYALGGISEIGRNMTVFEYNGRLLIVDVGVLFPSSGEPGVDLILPDFGPIENKLDKIDGMVITHGHEDHIGAIPWLLKLRHDIPIYSAKFTLALIAAKTKEHRQRPKMHEVTKDSDLNVGPFRLRFWTVGHSIPDALGVSIKAGRNHVVMTGDVKLDQTPYDGKPTDLPALSRFGDEGIDLFLCDSTNATTPGISNSEAGIETTLIRLVANARQRVVLSSFASNVSRVQMAVNAAVASNRKVAFNGRSMIRNMEIAEKMGYLKAPRGTIIDINEAAKLAPHKVMLVTTGTQGEPMAALSRMSRREHRQITIRPGDLIILSSSMIPGNEEAIFSVINNLSQIGAEIVTNKDANVHASGHGYAGELLFLYNAARPKNAMPVHGEWRHLRANGDLAVSTGVKREGIMLAQNGVVVDLNNGKAQVVGQFPVGHLYVDGNSMGEVEADVLADRTALGSGGVVSVTAVINDSTGRLLEAPKVSTTGVAEDDRGQVLELVEIAENTMNDLAAEGENDIYRMVQQLRRRLGRHISQKYGREPMILPTIVPIAADTGAVDDEDVEAARESL
ncbi:ribonuclease J [Corynebacterium guangdongense]|uniref:Ribonuclease J n=1 Tax=Corynebacterium guangdongense TaxID=1783348 RepID=A0ABU1ZX77_9CORY|nr:ribonuclease J [Corynebacterium guangdongense]MDR7329543.1 ribonuclease J [Corynebacterium guangdongense]WJZ18108.1 Putative ribonuclease J [Corynebacterium guangdongense]